MLHAEVRWTNFSINGRPAFTGLDVYKTPQRQRGSLKVVRVSSSPDYRACQRREMYLLREKWSFDASELLHSHSSHGSRV
jgi:hypothetical protein